MNHSKPVLYLYLRLCIVRCYFKASRTTAKMEHKQLHTQSSLLDCKAVKKLFVAIQSKSSVFPAQVKSCSNKMSVWVLWYSPHRLALGTMVPVGKRPIDVNRVFASGYGFRCYQDILQSLDVDGVWNPSSPLNHLPKAAKSRIYRQAVILMR